MAESDLIRIAELRQQVASAEGVAETGFEPVSLVDPGDLLALIEVAEAVHRANFDDDCGYCEKTPCPNESLRDALARFDWTST